MSEVPPRSAPRKRLCGTRTKTWVRERVPCTKKRVPGAGWGARCERPMGNRRRVSGYSKRGGSLPNSTNYVVSLKMASHSVDVHPSRHRDIDWWLENVGADKSPRTADHDRWALSQLRQHQGEIPSRLESRRCLRWQLEALGQPEASQAAQPRRYPRTTRPFGAGQGETCIGGGTHWKPNAMS